MKVNLHTHTAYCDGKNTAEEMILDAVSAGFDVLGFSGHSYTSFDESYCMSREQTAAYAAEIRTLAEKYREQITVLCGIEQDLYGDDPVMIGTSSGEFDYALGSVHAVRKDGRTWPDDPALPLPPRGIIAPGSQNTDGSYYIYVDGNDLAMEWAIHHIYSGDASALAEDYFAEVARIAELPGIQIAGHLDLLTKFEEKRAAEEKNPLFNTADPRYLQAAEKTIRTLTDAGIIFEINTGAIARGYRKGPYPAPALLEMIKKSGGKIMINSDCHETGKLDFGFDLAVNAAAAAGFTKRSVPDLCGGWMEVDL